MASQEGCQNKIAVRDGNIYIFQHENPLQIGQNPLVFADIHEYKKYVMQQLIAGSTCQVLKAVDSGYRHPDESYEGRQTIKVVKPPTLDDIAEAETAALKASAEAADPAHKTRRSGFDTDAAHDDQKPDEPAAGNVNDAAQDFATPWNTDTIRDLNDYEWNRVFPVGSGVSGVGPLGAQFSPAANAANLKNFGLTEGEQKGPEDYKMRDVKLEIGDAIIPPSSVHPRHIRQTAAERDQQTIGLSATDGVAKPPPPPPQNPEFEAAAEEMRRLYLQSHPEYIDATLVRTGVNQYEVTSVTPKTSPEVDVAALNRPLEDVIAAEDLKTYGGTFVDPQSVGLEYPRGNMGDIGDTFMRMFAPSAPMDRWGMRAADR